MVGERARFRILVCGVLLAAGASALAMYAALRWTDGGPSGSAARAKVFKRTLVEGLRVSRHGVYGVDFVKCGACRLEKRKRGPFTLGGMNVLVLEDLEVVLPKDETADGGGTSAGGGGGAEGDSRAVVRRLGISDGFLAKQGLPYKFSGVRVSNLAVGRLTESNTVERAFSARAGEAKRGGLALSGCVVFSGGAEAHVGHATLVMSSGRLRLVWQGGEMDLM